MTTLPEALAALDALICNDNSCFFTPAKHFAEFVARTGVERVNEWPPKPKGKP